MGSLYYILCILPTQKKQTSIFVFWKQKFKKKYYFVRFIDTIIIITYIIIIRELREKEKFILLHIYLLLCMIFIHDIFLFCKKQAELCIFVVHCFSLLKMNTLVYFDIFQGIH